jgi:hypothetical protein
MATKEKIVDYLAEELKKAAQKREERHARMRKMVADLRSVQPAVNLDFLMGD